MFGCVQELGEVKRYSQKVRAKEERLRSGLKALESLFSLVSAIADNAILIGLILFVEHSPAKFVKDVASLLKNIFAMLACGIMLSRCMDPTPVCKEISRRPKKAKRSSKVCRQETNRTEADEKRETMQTLVQAAIHTLALTLGLAAGLGLAPMDPRLSVCTLDMLRFSVKLGQRVAKIGHVR